MKASETRNVLVQFRFNTVIRILTLTRLLWAKRPFASPPVSISWRVKVRVNSPLKVWLKLFTLLMPPL